MRNWRVLTAIAAVVLAGLAAALAYQYLTEADERAQEDVELVEVLVAKEDIPRGTRGEEAIDRSLLETKEAPRNIIPDGALASAEGLTGLVAGSPVAQGQFIVRDTFVPPARVEGFSTGIRRDRQAISITVDDTHGVAGFIVPNDSINVMVTIDITDPLAPEGRDVPLTTTAYLIPGLKVLGVDDTTVNTPADSGDEDGDGTEEQVQAGLITVEVTARQALQIAHAVQSGGQLYVSLNSPKFDPAEFTVPAEIVEASNLFDQDLTAYNRLREAVNSAP